MITRCRHTATRILLLATLLLCGCGSPAPAAILVQSASGTYAVKTTLAAAAVAADAAGKTVVVTSPVTVTTAIVWPADRALDVRDGGKITFSGAGALTGLRETRPEWFNTGIIGAAAAVANGGRVIISTDYAGLVGKVTVSASNVTIQGNGFRTLTWSALGSGVSYGSLGTGTAAFEVTGENVTFENLSIVGPHSGTYSANAGGIVMVGTSSANRKSGLTLKNVEISNIGSYAWFAQFVDNITIDSRYYAHNVGYSGGTALSCDHIRVGAGQVSTVTPGTETNMYGMSFSHYSLGYNVDPNVGTKQAAHPFCSDVIVDGLVVEDVDWNGIDFHGAYDSTVKNCKVYNTKDGINLTASSGDASGYAGWGNSILNNIVDGRKQDGTTSGRENTGAGIVVQGGVNGVHKDMRVIGNVIRYKGVAGNVDSASINANYIDGIISGNTIEQWSGVGVLFNDAPKVTITGNAVNGVKDATEASSRAFSVTTANAPALIVTGNVVSALNGAAAAKVGFRAPAITTRPTLSGNDFAAATTPYSLSPVGARGGDIVSVVSVAALSTGTVSKAGTDKDCLIAFALAAPDSLTNITGGNEGDTITLTNAAANNVTIVHDISLIVNSTSANIVLGLRDTVSYRRWGTKWLQSSPLLVNP